MQKDVHRTESRRRRGFTIVELLVVVAVIGILAGFVLPLVGGMAERALDSQARDLCAQVAEAWSTLAATESRMPGLGLIDALSKKTPQVLTGKDVWFLMTPSIGCLLNEWHKTTQFPDADKERFHPAAKTQEEKKHFCPRVRPADEPLSYDAAVSLPVERLFERDMGQKRFGVYAPWFAAKIREAAEEAAETSGETVRVDDIDESLVEPLLDEPATGRSGPPWGHGIVRVAIDLDGDGKITIPAGLIDNKEDIELRTSAAAWVWNEYHDKTLRSW